MNRKRMAFMGFRHGHIMGLFELARRMPEIEIVGACEEDAATRSSLRDAGPDVTHTSYGDLLDETNPDIVAIGDAYGRRGTVAIAALERGIHVMSDKPICTALEELEKIRQLAHENHCRVGCQLDLRGGGKFLALRRLIREENAIGEVHAISFNGEHPLLYGERPSWYFEPGMHGGTINDIAVHAIDLLPWVTGLSFAKINAARNWNAHFAPEPHFRDAAQMMLTMENGCGVLGDVSYLVPRRMGYRFPLYWRFTFWGREGVIETSESSKGITLYGAEAEQGVEIDPDPGRPDSYLRSFLREIDGEKTGLSISTAEVLESSRITLLTQHAADTQKTNVELES